MVTFDLKGARGGNELGCSITTGHYPKADPSDPSEPDQVGWLVSSARGEPLGQPTVNLWSPPTYPADGCVFIKITPEFDGWLDSLIAAGLVEPTGRIEPAGHVSRYAAECRVLRPELRSVGR